MTVIKAYTSAVPKAYVRAVIPGSGSAQNTKIALTRNTDNVLSAGYVLMTPQTAYIHCNNTTTNAFVIGNNNLQRVRQNGYIKQVGINLGDKAGFGSLYFQVWRLDGATFDLVGEEDIYSKCTSNTLNVVTLDVPINVLDGDYLAFGAMGGTSGSNTVGWRSGGVANFSYFTSEIPTSPNYPWASKTALNNTLQLQAYNMAPMVVVIGSSLSAGHPLNYSKVEESYVTEIASSIAGQLYAISNKYVYQNMGIGSTKIADVKARFTADCVNLKPKIAIILVGNNDVPVTLKASYLADYTTILNSCASAGIIPVVLKIPPWTSASNAIMQTRDDWMASLKTLVETYEGAIFVNPDSSLGQFRVDGDVGNLWDLIPAYDSDGVHLTTAGYTKFAEVIDSEISKLYTLNTSLEAGTLLTATALSTTSIKLDFLTGVLFQGHSIERSTDGINFSEITTVSSPTLTYTDTGLTTNTLYYYRVRAYTGAVYESYSNVANTYTYYAMTITATGTGAGVATLAIKTSSQQVLTLDGNGKFYSDSGGTIEVGQSWTAFNGGTQTIYIKVSSGSSTLLIKAGRITQFGTSGTFGWTSSTNAPSISGDISGFTNAVFIKVNGNNALSGSITSLTNLKGLRLNGSPVITGSITNLTSLTSFYVDYATSSTGTISGNIEGLTSLISFYLDYPNTVTGDITNCTLITEIRVTGSNTLSGDIGSGNWINGVTWIRLVGNRMTSYTGGATWSNCNCTIQPSSGYGFDVAETSNILIDMYNSASITSKEIALNGTYNANMADANQGGIWGDFSGEPTPSTLATAVKNLKVTRSNSMYIRGLSFPGVTGDGIGFPAGFGNWWRS